MSQLSLDEQYRRMRAAGQDVTAFIDHLEGGATGQIGNQTREQLMAQAVALIGHLVEETQRYKRLAQEQCLEDLQAMLQDDQP